ncbi:MAG: MBL fold metallo-hydrolase [Acidobacteriota bacterium]|nr:MBL fold metallo-hydrolase [Acidobacteriota bacterium]
MTEKLEAALELAEPGDLADEQSRKDFIAKLPVHIKGSIGGNSSCVVAQVDDHLIIFDAGTGIRVLGLELLQREFGKGKGKAHLVFSHTHWDHIMGLPFFGPLFVPGNQFKLCGVHSDLETRLRGQQKFQYFPVSFDVFGSDIQFVDFSNKDSYQIGDARLTWREQYHPGKSFAYRLEHMGRSVIYATDAEYKDQTPEGLKETADFFRGADLVIFDSQYTLVECLEKEDWGHSSTFIGIKLALQAGVRKMAFFHHEPTYTDFRLMKILESSREFKEMIAPFNPLELVLAVEGRQIDLLAGDGISDDQEAEAEQVSN